jgi:hypothetical protein
MTAPVPVVKVGRIELKYNGRCYLGSVGRIGLSIVALSGKCRGNAFVHGACLEGEKRFDTPEEAATDLAARLAELRDALNEVL